MTPKDLLRPLVPYLPTAVRVYGLRGLLLPGLRVRIARALLPREFFVQSVPNNVDLRGWLEGALSEAAVFNHANRSHLHKPFDDVVRVLQLRALLEEVRDLEAGDYAEVGTYRGFSARILFRHRAPGASLHCFDTFEGFDDADARVEAEKTGFQVASKAFEDTSLRAARTHILGGASPDEGSALHLHKGRFPGTFAGLEMRRWRFVHLDADLYEPMIRGLELFYPPLVPGGIVVCHDYNNKYVGVKEAVDEFVARTRELTKIPLPDKGGSVVLRRPVGA